MNTPVSSDSQFSRKSLVVLPSPQHILNAMQQRLATAKTDMEESTSNIKSGSCCEAIFGNKVMVKRIVKDLEQELETATESCEENMQLAVLKEKKRFTQMQWDMKELQKRCLETTKIEVRTGTGKQLENLHKQHEELEVKSKADVKLLVKEVKSVRSSQSELQQELGRLMEEKLDLRGFFKRKSRECSMQILQIQNYSTSVKFFECSVNFLSEEEDKLIVDTSSPSDAIDLLTTSDNRIGLLLAEAQLLA